MDWHDSVRYANSLIVKATTMNSDKICTNLSDRFNRDTHFNCKFLLIAFPLFPRTMCSLINPIAFVTKTRWKGEPKVKIKSFQWKTEIIKMIPNGLNCWTLPSPFSAPSIVLLPPQGNCYPLIVLIPADYSFPIPFIRRWVKQLVERPVGKFLVRYFLDTRPHLNSV